MIRVLIAASALASGPALAQDVSILEPAFANTIVSTYPDGRKAKAWLNRDGTYRGQGRSGRESSGRWSLKADQICLKQTRPFPAPIAYCTGLIRGGVGARWHGKAVTGEPVVFELVSGRSA